MDCSMAQPQGPILSDRVELTAGRVMPANQPLKPSNPFDSIAFSCGDLEDDGIEDLKFPMSPLPKVLGPQPGSPDLRSPKSSDGPSAPQEHCLSSLLGTSPANSRAEDIDGSEHQLQRSESEDGTVRRGQRRRSREPEEAPSPDAEVLNLDSSPWNEQLKTLERTTSCKEPKRTASVDRRMTRLHNLSLEEKKRQWSAMKADKMVYKTKMESSLEEDDGLQGSVSSCEVGYLGSRRVYNSAPRTILEDGEVPLYTFADRWADRMRARS